MRHKATLRIVLLISFLLLLGAGKPDVVCAGTNVWTTRGPEGGWIYTLAINPATPTTLYAGTQGGVYKSTDRGGSWTPVNNSLPALWVRALVIDPVTPTTLYAAISGAVFKSTNGGGDWSMVMTGLTYGLVNALTVDPVTPTTLYAGTAGGGLYKSTNGGGNWSAVNTGLSYLYVRVLAIDPLTPATLYAGTLDGVFRSTNGGDNWTEVSTGLTSRNIAALSIDPDTPTTLYTGTLFGGAFKSTDSGENWSPINTGLPSEYIEALAIDPATPTTLYAGTFRDPASGGVYKSIDGGGSWSPVNTGLTSPGVRALAIDPETPAILYAGTGGGGVFKSMNGSESWTAANTGLIATHVEVLAIDPTTPAIVYAGTYRSGLFKSIDSGGSWSAVNSGLTNPYVQALAIDPVMPATLYAGTRGDGVFKSTDGGGSWSPVNTGLTGTSVWALAIDPSTPATLYAGTYYGGVFRSTNGGGSWTPVNTGLTDLPVYTLAIDPVTPATLYAGTEEGGVFKSTDSGASWGEVNTGLTSLWVWTLAVDPATPTTLYAGTDGSGVFKSINGGDNWGAVNVGLTTTYVEALAIDPTAPATLYASGNSVSKSTNGGENWIALSAGLPNTMVRDLAVNPATPATLYAGTEAGVYDMQQVELLDLGFHPNPDGYGFANPGGQALGCTLFTEIFPDEPIECGQDDQPIQLTQAYTRTQRAFGTGLCVGMSATTLDYFVGGLASPRPVDTFLLTYNESWHNIALYHGRLRSEAFWQATYDEWQLWGAGSNTSELVARVYGQLRDALRPGFPDPATAMLWPHPPNPAGVSGHAVTPYRIDETDPLNPRVYVYENIAPGNEERYIQFDLSAEPYSFQYTGNGTWNSDRHSLVLAPTSIWHSEDADVFHDGQTASHAGGGDLLISSEGGEEIGYAGGVLTATIPGAMPIFPWYVPEAGEVDDLSYILPSGNYTGTISGATEPYRYTMWTSSTEVLVQTQSPAEHAQIIAAAGTQDHVFVDETGTTVSLQVNDVLARTLSFSIVQIEQGASRIYEIGSLTLEPDAMHTASVTDADGLRLQNDGSGTSYHLGLQLQTIGSPTTRFYHEGISIGAGDIQTVTVPNWQQMVTVTLQIDLGGDGTVDETIVLNNQLRKVYLPLILRGQ